MENLRQVEVTIKHIEFNWNTQKNHAKDDEILQGVFHGWEDFVNGLDYSKKFAIVELENGEIRKFTPEQIRFTGKPGGANIFEEGLEIE